MRYVKKHPVGSYSKNEFPKSDHYEFEDQNKEAMKKFFLLSLHKYKRKLSILSHNNNKIEKILWSMKKYKNIIQVDDELDESTKNKLEDYPR